MIEIPEITKEILFNLKEDPTNPNIMTKEQIESVANSIKKYGFLVPIIINKDNVIIDGHQRKIAAEHLGMDEVPVIKLNVDKVDQKILKQIMNKLKGTHDYDLDLQEYKAILEQQGNLDDLKKFVAMDDEYINNILRELEPKGQHTEEELEEVPEAATIKTDIKYGDIIQLGSHRIMCGDSTKKEDVDKLMNGQKADMVFTDPPYGIDYKHDNRPAERPHKFDKLINDNIDLDKLLLPAFNNMSENIKDGAVYYCWHSGKTQREFQNYLENAGFLISTTIIWSKGHFAFSRQDYHPQHEPCFYGWKKGAKHLFYGERNQSTIWQELYDSGNRTAGHDTLHPTQKPIKLGLRAINNSSKHGDLVLDLFLGSGSTLIACEQTGRICYGMEIDPKYCEVICQRYEKLYNKPRIYVNRVKE